MGTILLGMINTIVIGLIIYWATNRYAYILNVLVYTITRSALPILTSLIFAIATGLSIKVSFGAILGSILIGCIPTFIIGLFVIKILEKVIDWFSYDNILYFIVSFAIIDFAMSWLFQLLLGLFF